MASPQNSKPLWAMKDDLEAEYPTATNYQVVLLNTSPNEVTVTAGSFSGATITANGHGFVTGQVLTTNTTLGAWTAGAIRYVVADTVNTFQVSSTAGGAAETITGGSATISDVSIINPVYINPPQAELVEWDEPQNLDAILAKEIPNYDGLGSRPQIQRTAAATIDRANNLVKLELDRATLDNTGGSAIISFDAWAVITGGSTSPGNTTGTFKGWTVLGSAYLLDQSQPIELVFTRQRKGA